MRRVELGLKAVDVADKLGISKQLLSNFENGKSNNLILAIQYTEVLNYEDDKQRIKSRAEPPEQFGE
ncbi:MAG: helix-turn-helix transcriptional regulator [Alphaproteobacteria bacterium]|nr:helix-turn-helix transcriptional regulator [Alphaproteobacteria bacterium]